MNTITFNASKNIANTEVSCPKCGGTKPSCCRCPDEPAPTAEQFIYENPFSECDYDVCAKRSAMIAALRTPVEGESK